MANDPEEENVKPDPRQTLSKWLSRSMRIKMSDGRTLVGQFLCTDQARNVILGSAQEYLNYSENSQDEPRMLGLAMVPGKYIVSMQVDMD
uniref:N-alpha-acetyltransferase 38-A, NatC auxiliary subunit-like n=1 Tax=Phallusia mammillata TaxID=59560 RepID=A0A6F9DMG1_9ASCI|nr:N-alpha-acetyltransferase 38-A, NatC auxiliary subunit-like [Phallusia mammillata]